MKFSLLEINFMAVNQGTKKTRSQSRCMSEACDGAKITMDTLGLGQLQNCVAHLVYDDGKRISLYTL